MNFQKKIFDKWVQLPQERIHEALVAIFCCYMLLFAFGRIFIQVGQIASLLLLSAYYAKGMHNTNLSRFKGKKFFIVFFLYLVLNVLLSEWPDKSYRAITGNIWKSFVIPFIAIELVRSERDLRKLMLAFAGAAFLQGLDGIWQYHTGYDIIHQTHIFGHRLTGSMKTPRVGNYMAIIIPAAFGLILFLKQKKIKLSSILSTLLLSPALFLLLNSHTRSGYIGLAIAFFSIWLFIWPPFKLYKIIIPVCFVSIVLLFGPSRISIDVLLQDPRWEIWSFSLKIFENFPIFGTGLKTFAPARDLLGLKHVIALSEIPHPHNIYLQFLVDGGIVGFSACIFFLFGLLFFVIKKIKPNLKVEIQEKSTSYYWRYTTFFLGGYIAYLGTGISAHDFFRPWWLTIGMTMLGIVIGATCSPFSLKTKICDSNK